MRRPLIVWVGQFIVGMAGALLVYGSYRWGRFILDGLEQGARLNSFWLTIEAAWRIALLVLFAATFWLISRGKPAGRWMGVISMLAILAIAVWGHIARPDAASAGGRAALQGTDLAIRVLIGVAFLALIYRFACSRRSRAYFSAAGPESSRISA